MQVTLPNFIRQFDGPLTSELLRDPGGFGLGQVPRNFKPDATTDAVCGYCSTGCSLRIHLKDREAVNISPTSEYPVNVGMACPKGWEALAPLSSPDRALAPLVREGDSFVQTDWDSAMKQFRDRVREIQAKHGNDSLAFLSTGQMCTEEMAFLGALAKCGIGIDHGDGNTRQCMATSVVSYKQSFGFDAPPYTYADFEESDCIILIGSNLCLAHPIMWQRVLSNKRNPEIVVIDPRRTETAAAATQHLAINPKSDLTLLYGLARLLVKNGAVDREFIANHTEDYQAFKTFVSRFSTERVCEETGLTLSQLDRLADTIKEKERVSFWWTMGVNQSHQATRTAQAIINLALMTGNIGRPGTGANSITGQCNAMGSRMFSNTTGLFGGREFANPEHRSEVAEITGIPEASIPTENCLAYDQIIDGIDSGRIKGLWVIATNTAHSWSGGRKLQERLKKLDFLVVQDMYGNTETAKLADMVLPAAGWGEKEGTVINSERRIGLFKKVSRAPGVALSDFSIFKLAAEYFGVSEMFEKWTDPESAFKILAELSKGRPCDFSGIKSYNDLDEMGGIQWPYPEGSNELPRERRLFEDGEFYHPGKRAKFIFDDPTPLPEETSDEFPIVLLTGRGTSAQWHTQTRTGQSGVLKKLYPESIYLEIHPSDARDLGLAPGDSAIVESKRGKIEATTKVTSSVKPGEIFIPMHYKEVNQLTLEVVDPYSRQPSYKHCAVRVTAK